MPSKSRKVIGDNVENLAATDLKTEAFGNEVQEPDKPTDGYIRYTVKKNRIAFRLRKYEIDYFNTTWEKRAVNGASLFHEAMKAFMDENPL